MPGTRFGNGYEAKGMNPMASVLGDFLICISGRLSVELPAKALSPQHWPEIKGRPLELTVQMPTPGILIAYTGDIRCLVDAARGGLGLSRVPEHSGAGDSPSKATDASLQAWITNADWQPTDQRGRFFYAGWDAKDAALIAFTDLFRSYPIYYCATPDGFICASDLRLMLAAMGSQPTVDTAAIYHYLNFACIPSPRSAIAGVHKLEPGSRLEWRHGKVTVRRFTDARYLEDLTGTDAQRADGLREQIVSTVSSYCPAPATPWGTYLSGGTDSSSIAGILARANAGVPVDSFSIGFGEGAYDELPFSRIAVRHFGLAPHERVVNEVDSVAAIPLLVRAFDEPFGNSSAIPTYYCAELAGRAGKQLLIAGDGGDEIFGGNQRYAKDQVFQWFHEAPALVRRLGGLLARSLRGTDSHLGNRIKNMIHRGTLPNPDRFYSDDSFASDHYEELLEADFRAQVNRNDSLQVQREIFARAKTSNELHRLMYLDLQMAIAENDVVKVVRSAKIAGIDVAFPYLDSALVDYTGRLPSRFKVNVLKKRYLFKLAMAGILPDEIIKKKKQGFGLPLAVWLRQDGPIRELVNDVLRSQRAQERGYFRKSFVEQLMERHERGSWDYSSEIFRLLMLELWHCEYLDGQA